MAAAGNCLPLFFFNDTATTEIYALSLHDALPILLLGRDATKAVAGIERDRIGREIAVRVGERREIGVHLSERAGDCQDRKSTRLNSTHTCIPYPVFCLNKRHPEDLADVPPAFPEH